MTLLLCGLALFLGMHSVMIVAPGLRTAAMQRLGAGGWRGLYSLAAAVGLGLIVYGFAAAKSNGDWLYVPQPGMKRIALLVMLPVFPLLAAAYLPGHIKAALRHPMLLATVLWATAHLLANGRAPDVALFGAFLVWALADLVSLSLRAAKPAAAAPKPPKLINDAIAVVVGLAIYGALMGGLHKAVIGVSPLGAG